MDVSDLIAAYQAAPAAVAADNAKIGVDQAQLVADQGQLATDTTNVSATQTALSAALATQPVLVAAPDNSGATLWSTDSSGNIDQTFYPFANVEPVSTTPSS